MANEKLTAITQAKEGAYLDGIGGSALPDNPSDKGLSATEIKHHISKPDKYIFGLVKRAIDEINTALGTQYTLNDSLQSQITANASGISTIKSTYLPLSGGTLTGELKYGKLCIRPDEFAVGGTNYSRRYGYDSISTIGAPGYSTSITIPLKSGTFALTSDITDAISSLKSGSSTFSGSNTFNEIVVNKLVVTGTIYTVNEAIVESKEHVIELAHGNTQALTSPSGFYVRNYDGSKCGGIFFDNDGTAYVGDITFNENGTINISNCVPLMGRAKASDLTDSHLLIWDNANQKLVDSGYTIASLIAYAVTSKENVTTTLTLVGCTGEARISLNLNDMTACVYGEVTVTDADTVSVVIPSTVKYKPTNKVIAQGDDAGEILPILYEGHTVDLTYGSAVGEVIKFNFGGFKIVAE
jgi:hypothetical protein